MCKIHRADGPVRTEFFTASDTSVKFSHYPNSFAPDVHAYALEFGTTLDEAQHRLDLQIEIGDLDQRLAASEAGTFAGLWIQHEPDFKVITKFTDDGESTIRPYISEGNLEDLVDVGTASSTLASLRSAQTAAIEKAMSLSAVFESGINVFDNRVEIYTLDREALKSDLDGAGLTLSDKVNIVEVPHLSVPTTDIHGGLALTTCTSGFSVEHSDGTKGVTSAAHCQSDQSYMGTQLPKRDQYYGESGDVQWHTTPGFTVENRIYTDAGETDITGTLRRAYQSVASYVCKQGKETGHGCGYVADNSFRPTHACPGGCTWNATFVLVRASTGQRLSQFGDSGGPFYSNNRAWGTMMAKREIESGGNWVRTDAVYMPIDYLDIMDVEVLTN